MTDINRQYKVHSTVVLELADNLWDVVLEHMLSLTDFYVPGLDSRQAGQMSKILKLRLK